MRVGCCADGMRVVLVWIGCCADACWLLCGMGGWEPHGSVGKGTHCGGEGEHGDGVCVSCSSTYVCVCVCVVVVDCVMTDVVCVSSTAGGCGV